MSLAVAHRPQYRATIKGPQYRATIKAPDRRHPETVALITASEAEGDRLRQIDPSGNDFAPARVTAMIDVVSYEVAPVWHDDDGSHSILDDLGLDRDEMRSIGHHAALEYQSRFDPSRDVLFSTFARPRVKGAMLDAIAAVSKSAGRSGPESTPETDPYSGEVIEMVECVNPDARTVEDLVLTAETANQVRRLLASLTPDDQALVAARYCLDGREPDGNDGCCSWKTVGLENGMSSEQARKRCQRAIVNLQTTTEGEPMSSSVRLVPTGPIPDPHQRPFLTVEEAGEVLGLCRSTAFKLARQYLDGGGGIPCLRVGRKIIVRTTELRRMAGMGEVAS